MNKWPTGINETTKRYSLKETTDKPKSGTSWKHFPWFCYCILNACCFVNASSQNELMIFVSFITSVELKVTCFSRWASQREEMYREAEYSCSSGGFRWIRINKLQWKSTKVFSCNILKDKSHLILSVFTVKAFSFLLLLVLTTGSK